MLKRSWLLPSLLAFTGLFPLSAHADIVVLTTGERLVGTIVERTDDTIVFAHPVLGTLSLNTDSVEQAIVEEAVADAPEEAPVEPEPEVEIEEESEWKSRIDLGFSFSEGNTENSNLFTGFKSERDNEKETTTFDASYYFSEDDGETSENKATVGINQDWKLPDSKWLIFARARYDYDEFNSWKSRVTAGGGLGYRFIEEDDFELTGRAGLVAVQEYDSERDDVRLEGLLGVDLSWNIDEHQSFEVKSTYFYDFEESGEFRTITDAGWKLNLPQYAGASIFIGLRHEYQSLVDPGQDETDLFVTGGLSIEF